MKYQLGSFSVHLGSDLYRQNYDRIFRGRAEVESSPGRRPADGPCVVFLDVDGVLAPILDSGVSAEIFQDDPRFNPDCVQRLNDLLHITRARIVVSSTWRLHHELRSLRRIFRRNGITAPIIDYTPELDADAFRREWGRAVERGDEIRAWLAEQDVLPRSYVILDDDEDFRGEVRTHLARTRDECGLQDIDITKALRILEVKP